MARSQYQCKDIWEETIVTRRWDASVYNTVQFLILQTWGNISGVAIVCMAKVKDTVLLENVKELSGESSDGLSLGMLKPLRIMVDFEM